MKIYLKFGPQPKLEHGYAINENSKSFTVCSEEFNTDPGEYYDKKFIGKVSFRELKEINSKCLKDKDDC